MMPQILKEYRDLAGAFSEEDSNILPPPTSQVTAIEIKPGAKLSKPKMYSCMTPKKMVELRKYIDANLARGFIQPAKSRVTAAVHFKEKKDGVMRVCIDFHSINAVCVENTSPSPS